MNGRERYRWAQVTADCWSGVAQLLPGHDVTSVKAAGFTGLKNGELLRRAAAAGYALLVTPDRNLPDQQNVRATPKAIFLAPGNRLAEIAPRSREIDEAVRVARLERLIA